VEYETYVEIDFTQHSASAASANKRSRSDEFQPTAQKKAAPKNEAPAAVPKKPAPPVLTAPSPLPPTLDIPSPEKAEPEVLPEAVPTPVEIETPRADPAPPASTVDETGAANSSAKNSGSPDSEDDSTVADEGSGRASIGSALDGEGVLVREVVYRPNLDEVIRENGTIALNICINPRGTVIGVKWNEERSTIKDTDIVRVAIEKTTGYRFKRDMSAPSRECGTLSILVNGL